MPEAAIGGAISGVGSLIGGVLSSNAAGDAARIQANAANNATDLQKQVLSTIHGELGPYRDIGNSLIPDYIGAISSVAPSAYGPLPTPLGPNSYAPYATAPTTTGANVPAAFDYQKWGLGADQQKALESTPGYQFTLTQGLRGVQNAAAASGRGVSGNALAGAADYATGLADKTYNQRLTNALTTQGQAFGQTLQGQGQRFTQNLGANAQNYNQLLSGQGQDYAQVLQKWQAALAALQGGIAGGQSATTGGGQMATAGLPGISNTITGGAAATAGGIVGGTNALSGGLSNAGNSISNALLLNRIFGQSNNNNNSGADYGGGWDFA